MGGPIFVRGAQSAIAQALAELHPIEEVVREFGWFMPDDGDKYLFCVGLIRQEKMRTQTLEEQHESLYVNLLQVVNECDRLIDENPRARICVIGSESGFKGSFDETYAIGKAALHTYVETKRLKYPDQQLVCVAPTCILNTSMNRQRNADGVAALEARRLTHPKQRWLQPIEVARLVHYLLCVDEGYLTNTVIRLNGGEHCR